MTSRTFTMFMNLLGFAVISLGVAGLWLWSREAIARQSDLSKALEVKSREIEQLKFELENSRSELLRLSSTDPVTGLVTRKQFDERIDSEWRRALRSDYPISLLLVEVDAFAAFVQAYGKGARDTMLRDVARALAGSLHRAGDLIARYEEDSFAAVLSATNEEGAMRVAENFTRSIDTLRIPHHGSWAGYLSISIGFGTLIPSAGWKFEQLVMHAQESLLTAKGGGRDEQQHQAVTSSISGE